MCHLGRRGNAGDMVSGVHVDTQETFMVSAEPLVDSDEVEGRARRDANAVAVEGAVAIMSSITTRNASRSPLLERTRRRLSCSM